MLAQRRMSIPGEFLLTHKFCSDHRRPLVALTVGDTELRGTQLPMTGARRHVIDRRGRERSE